MNNTQFQMQQPVMTQPVAQTAPMQTVQGTVVSGVTSFAQLQDYAKGQLVELPPFAEGMPFVARMRRPSMLAMMKSGRIPNSLLGAANALFAGQTTKVAMEDDGLYQEVFEITETLARSALVEPTYDDIVKAGMEMTDDQFMFIFNYTQAGVKALENFRKDEANPANSQYQPTIQQASQ